MSASESRRQLLNQTAFVESHSCCMQSLTLAVCSAPRLYLTASLPLSCTLPVLACQINVPPVQPSTKTFLPHSSPAPPFGDLVLFNASPQPSATVASWFLSLLLRVHSQRHSCLCFTPSPTGVWHFTDRNQKLVLMFRMCVNGNTGRQIDLKVPVDSKVRDQWREATLFMATTCSLLLYSLNLNGNFGRHLGFGWRMGS